MAEKRLYDAASTGDTNSLQELLQEDPLLLNRVSFTSPNKTPLHIATIHCQLPFIEEILNLNPQLAEELDSQLSSPLHIASAKGHVEIARKLLSAAPDMCLSRDCQGRNPLHVAAMKGHVEVLAEIIQTVPCASREQVGHRNDTVLHLCIKYGQLEALEILVLHLNELLDEENDDGDTILHLAVRDRRIEIIQYLVGNSNIDVNAKNSKGQTPMDILQQNPSHPTNSQIIHTLAPRLHTTTTQTQEPKSLNQTRDSIMVVAVLIATMAFQAGVTPPGGVRQDNLTEDPSGKPLLHPQFAGESVIAHRRPIAYKNFIFANTTAFVTSMATIMFLINGLKGPVFMWVLRVIMSLTLTSIAATYVIALLVVTPKRHWRSLTDVIEHGLGLGLWCGVMGIVVVGNVVSVIGRRFKNKGIVVWRPRRSRDLGDVRNGTGC
ncbi:hypothetical protein BUALT_Bualt15G0072800 [Buddleja alternifolia]|uniref:PGG domain-containing protein n=1 Tax=Buddleja alternifolia TaxID=168488 RepID=A0AAV6WDD6_9LAMI|nr:hypothetical protein BUALT_Bualt15G0072800 [Buddleja alternifolia]